MDKKQKIAAIIPARYAASRFPGKLMALLDSKPVIVQTYLATVATNLFDEVIVATDHEDIASEILKVGGKVFKSQRQHESGSDRIAEAAANMDMQIVVNIQGDEPFVQREPLLKLLEAFKDDHVQVATLVQPLTDLCQQNDPNFVKVVADKWLNALYFSRSLIPFVRDKNISAPIYEHVGVYGYTKSALLKMVSWPPSPLELVEKLEQLRLLENGIAIKLVNTGYVGIEIDTPEDLAKANELVKTGKLKLSYA